MPKYTGPNQLLDSSFTNKPPVLTDADFSGGSQVSAKSPMSLSEQLRPLSDSIWANLAIGSAKTGASILGSADVLGTMNQAAAGQPLDKNRLLSQFSALDSLGAANSLAGRPSNWTGIDVQSPPPSNVPNFAGQTPEQQQQAFTPSNPTQQFGAIVTQGLIAASPIIKDAVPAAGDALKQSAVNRVLAAQETAIDTAGKIVQGKKIADQPAANVLSKLDTSGVRTYSDLGSKLNEFVQSNLKKVDTEFAKNPTPQPLESLTKTFGEGDTSIKINYVQDAIEQLKELYTKTKEPSALVKINQLETKANSAGLTPSEINNLARQYGTEFGSKAFTKTGDPLTSVNARAFENTRAGIKGTARSFLTDETAKVLDKTISEALNTKILVDKMTEAVNKLQRRVNQRGLGEKIGRAVGGVVDVATGGALKGLFKKIFLESNVGLKKMNALDLEAQLQKNLKIVQDLNKTPDETLPGKILDYVKTVQTGLAMKDVSNIPKDRQPLAKEAQKYGSAEDFVKAQTNAYHGTNQTFSEFNADKARYLGDHGAGMWGQGTYLSDAGTAKNYGKNVMPVYADITNPLDLAKFKSIKEAADTLGMSEDALTTTHGIVRPVESQAAQFSSHVRDLGYDAIKVKTGPKTVETVVLDPSKIMTKSQLIDLYNQVKGIKSAQ